MKFFTSILEAKTTVIEPISENELKEYIEKVGKKLPQDVQILLHYCQKYNILSKDQLDAIMSANKTQLKRIANTLGIPDDEMEDIQKLVNGLGSLKSLIPQFQTEKQRKDILSGKRQIGDASLDLESEKGRAKALKTYMPLINKMVNQYEGKSSLSRSELLSAALEGFTLAMNDYNAPDDNYIDSGDKDIDSGEAVKMKKLTFKQYAAYRIRWAILGDMNDSRVVRIPKSQYQKNVEAGNPSANYNAVSIDALLSDDPDSESKADRMKELSVEQRPTAAAQNAEALQWKKIFAILDSKFSTKIMSVFYKYFGMNGYKKMSGVEIAKELNCTKAYVSKVIKQVTTFMKDDPRTSEMLLSIRDLYTESILIQCLDKGAQVLLETFAQDDIYMMLEEMTKWSNPAVLASNIQDTLKDYDSYSKTFIIECLENGFEWLDSNYRKNKKLLIHFLENMMPTESLSRKSDAYILGLMNELIEAYQKIK